MYSLKGLVLASFFAATVSAQFYAPETERHDPVQRFFVVELARVRAWYENGKFPGIAEVKFAVTTQTNGATSWDLQWVDREGKAVSSAVVEYPSDLLEKGPEF